METASNAPMYKRESALKSILGHILERSFWIKLAKDMLEAAFFGFMSALGGVLWKYGNEKLGTSQPLKTPDSSIASKAFGNSYSPTPTYNQGYNTQPPTGGSERFPGFR